MLRHQSKNKKRSKRKWKRGYVVAAAAAHALGLNKKGRKRAQRKWLSTWNALKSKASLLSWKKLGLYFLMITTVFMMYQWMLAQDPIEDIKVVPFKPALIPDAGDADLQLTGDSPSEAATVDVDANTNIAATQPITNIPRPEDDAVPRPDAASIATNQLAVPPELLEQIRALPPMPKIVHVVWPDKDIVSSSYEMIQHGLHRIATLSPEWEIRVHDYKDIEQRFRATSLLTEDDKKKIATAHIVEQTDAFRLLLIYEVGGLWIDIDRVVNRPLSEVIQDDTKMMLPTYSDINFAQDLFASSPGNPLVLNAMNFQWDLRRQKPRKKGWLKSSDHLQLVHAFSWSLERDLFGHRLASGDKSEWNAARQILKETGSLIVTTKDVWCDGMVVTPYEGCTRVSRQKLYSDYGVTPWVQQVDAVWADGGKE